MRAPSEYLGDYFKSNILPDFLGTYDNKRTAEEYFSAVNMLCDFVKKDFLDVTCGDADSYFSVLDDSISAGSFSPHTYNVRLSLYKNLADYILEKCPGVMEINPFMHLSRKITSANIDISKIPTMKELDQILCAAKEYSSMYYVIISLVGRLALTSSSIVSLDASNVLTENGRVMLYFPRHGKTPEQVVMLPEDVQLLLTSYLENATHLSRGGYLFINSHGNPLSLRILDRHFSNILSKSGVCRRYTLRDVRTRAVLEMTKAALDNNVELSAVASYTGLRSLRMSSFAEACVHHTPCPADLVNFRLNSHS